MSGDVKAVLSAELGAHRLMTTDTAHEPFGAVFVTFGDTGETQRIALGPGNVAWLGNDAPVHICLDIDAGFFINTRRVVCRLRQGSAATFDLRVCGVDVVRLLAGRPAWVEFSLSEKGETGVSALGGGAIPSDELVAASRAKAEQPGFVLGASRLDVDKL